MLYKFLSNGRVGPYSGFEWPESDWVDVVGKLRPCRNGVHVCREADLLGWLDAELYEVEIRGEQIDCQDKICVRSARLVRRVESWNDCSARLFAADCAEDVLHIFEREYPDDSRPRDAIVAARAYARGEIDAAARDAAWDAARAAAWAAAWDAAGDAAGDAARAAAWAAARDAAGDAARAAARDAARAAARDAARAAQRAKQTARLLEIIQGAE